MEKVGGNNDNKNRKCGSDADQAPPATSRQLTNGIIESIEIVALKLRDPLIQSVREIKDVFDEVIEDICQFHRLTKKQKTNIQ